MPLRPVGNSDGVPAKQPLRGQRLVVALCRVEHHLHDAFDVAVGGLSDRRCPCRAGARPTSAPGRRRAFSPSISLLFSTSSVSVRRTASSLTLKPSASIWPSRRPCRCLAAASGAARRLVVPAELRPVRKLMDIVGHSPQLCGDYMPYSPHMSIIHRMICGEYRRVFDPVEHAAVAVDQRAVVLDAAIALDRRHDQSAREPHHRHDERHRRGRRAGENGVAHQIAAPSAVAETTPPSSPSQVLFGLTDGATRRRPMRLSPDVLQHVAQLHDEHEKEHQRRRLLLVARNPQHQQRRHVADEIDADHQPPLVGRRALEESLGVACQRGPDGEEHRDVDRDQDAEQAVPADPDQRYCSGVTTKKRPEQRAMIAGAGRRQRDELAKREQRDRREQQRWTRRALS